MVAICICLKREALNLAKSKREALQLKLYVELNFYIRIRLFTGSLIAI